MTKRVVITGMGTVNPLGNSVESFYRGLQEGKSGIGPITAFDPAEYASKIAGELKDFNATDFMEKREARKMAKFTQYAVASTTQAMEQAGLKRGDVEPSRMSVIIGNGIGGFEFLEESYFKLFEKGPKRVPPMIIPKLISNEAPGNIAIKFGATGESYAVVTACASATDAIGNAVMSIKNGRSDVVITGGTEGCITRMGIAGFSVLQALSTEYNDTPEKASRPFDKKRDGFIMAEGAGVLIVEELEHAKKRGANIIAEVKGFGRTCDAYHLTAPDAEGRGGTEAIKLALEDASFKPEDIDYINAHGTSTPTNDPIETLAIKNAFGSHAYNLKVSSTKSMTGHCIGAAGGIEAIACILGIQNNYYPPTINLDEPDEKCDLDYVANKGVNQPMETALSISLGFGGHNAVAIFTEYKE